MSKDDYLSPRLGAKDGLGTSPIPSISIKKEGDFPANSSDIKRQLSQHLGSGGVHGGISKPTSRRGSMVRIRLHDDDDDDEDQGIERKRRDNINDKIQELLTLIPKEFFDDKKSPVPGSPSSESVEEMAMRNSGTKDGKPNKGQILTKSVEYIQHLQNLIDENNRKEMELILKLRKLGINGNLNEPIHTSAEYALGKIGVGPLSAEYFKEVLVSSVTANKAPQRRGSLS